MGSDSPCSNICDDDPIPAADLPKVEEAYESFCDSGINFAIIGIKEQVEQKWIEKAKKLCKEHGKDEKYRYHSSIFVYCSNESKMGYCLEIGNLLKKKDKPYYKNKERFYYHKEKESAGGVRFQKVKREDYLNKKCKEGCIYLTTDMLNGKSFMEKAEKNFVFDVKNYDEYKCNCHKFILEAVIALSAKIRYDQNNRCIKSFADEILDKIEN